MNLNKVTLNTVDQSKWYKNTILFLAPVGIIYLGAFAFTLQSANHVFLLKDFVPSSFTMGAIVLYFINAGLDYLRKLQG